MTIFSHHGDMGDVVYSLMAVKSYCDEADGPCSFVLAPADYTRARMTESHAAALLPLLRAQPFVALADWRPAAFGVRIDLGMRRFWRGGLNLADQHAHYLGTPYSGGGGPWLTADPLPLAPVVFARSQRYRSPSFPWRRAYERFGRSAAFVGTAEEHADFEAAVGPVPRADTPTLLDAARVIAGAKLFVGNQSCPRAVAEGLKVPVCVEQGRHQTCHFARPDAWYDRLPPATFEV